MAMDDPRTTLLTEGQRRHLTATLALVERAVADVAALAGGATTMDQTLLSPADDDIPPALREPLRSAATDVVAILEQLVRRFGLAPSGTSRRRTAEALLTSSLVEIEDTVSGTLRGYGEVHPELAGYLDPLLDRLHRRIGEMRRLLAPP